MPKAQQEAGSGESITPVGCSTEASGFLVGPTVFNTVVGAQAPRRVRFPSASAELVKDLKSKGVLSDSTLSGISISTLSPTIVAGASATFTAQGIDAYGNLLGDVTGATTFSIAPDGSCTLNVCTATIAGSHTVTGTDGAATTTASLSVVAGALDHIVLSPDGATITAGGSQTYTAEAFDSYGTPEETSPRRPSSRSPPRARASPTSVHQPPWGITSCGRAAARSPQRSPCM